MKDRMREGQYDCDEEAEVGNVNTCKEYYMLRKVLTAKVEHDQCEMLAEDKKTWEKGQITFENENGTFDLYLDKDIASGQYHSWVPTDEVRRLPKSPEVKAKLDEVRSKPSSRCLGPVHSPHLTPHLTSLPAHWLAPFVRDIRDNTPRTRRWRWSRPSWTWSSTPRAGTLRRRTSSRRATVCRTKEGYGV
jgi:hypothetical protein